MSAGLGLGFTCPGCSSKLTLSAAEVAGLEVGDVLSCCCSFEVVITRPGSAGVEVRARGPVFACPGCAAELEAPAELVSLHGAGERLSLACPECARLIDLALSSVT